MLMLSLVYISKNSIIRPSGLHFFGLRIIIVNHFEISDLLIKVLLKILDALILGQELMQILMVFGVEFLLSWIRNRCCSQIYRILPERGLGFESRGGYFEG